MAGRQLTISVWVMLGFLLSLAGCEGDTKEKEMLAADAAKAKAELVKVQDVLKQTESERDTLKGEMTKITESLDKAKSEIAAVTLWSFGRTQSKALIFRRSRSTLIPRQPLLYNLYVLEYFFG